MSGGAAAGHLAEKVEVPELGIHTKISISDGASIFRKATPKHLHPYDSAVRKFGNSLIKKWIDEVAIKLPGKKGEIDQADLAISMSSVFQKSTLDKLVTRLDLLQEPSDEQVEKISLFLKDTPVDELVTFGHPFVINLYEVLKMKAIIQNFKILHELTEFDEDIFESHRKIASLPASARVRMGNGHLTEEDLQDIGRKIQALLHRENIFGPNPLAAPGGS